MPNLVDLELCLMSVKMCLKCCFSFKSFCGKYKNLETSEDFLSSKLVPQHSQIRNEIVTYLVKIVCVYVLDFVQILSKFSSNIS